MHSNIKQGCFVDTSILFAASYTPDLFNEESEELFDFFAELKIPLFTNVNVRSEFMDLHRKVMVPEGLSDLYTSHGKALNKVLYTKLQSVYTSLSKARKTGKPYKFDENQIKSWRQRLSMYQMGNRNGWIQFCADFLLNRIELIWDNTCEELGINFFSLRHADHSDWLTQDLKWEDMATLVGRFGIGSFDAMIINLFLNSKFSVMVSADKDLVYVIDEIKPKDKFICIPDSLTLYLHQKKVCCKMALYVTFCGIYKNRSSRTR